MRTPGARDRVLSFGVATWFLIPLLIFCMVLWEFGDPNGRAGIWFTYSSSLYYFHSTYIWKIILQVNTQRPTNQNHEARLSPSKLSARSPIRKFQKKLSQLRYKRDFSVIKHIHDGYSNSTLLQVQITGTLATNLQKARTSLNSDEYPAPERTTQNLSIRFLSSLSTISPFESRLCHLT